MAMWLCNDPVLQQTENAQPNIDRLKILNPNSSQSDPQSSNRWLIGELNRQLNENIRMESKKQKQLERISNNL